MALSRKFFPERFMKIDSKALNLLQLLKKTNTMLNQSLAILTMKSQFMHNMSKTINALQLSFSRLLISKELAFLRVKIINKQLKLLKTKILYLMKRITRIQIQQTNQLKRFRNNLIKIKILVTALGFLITMQVKIGKHMLNLKRIIIAVQFQKEIKIMRLY